MAMIEVKNITKSFGKLTVLKDFSVDFTQDGVTVILGPSGTGKSTLLRCINGLEKIDAGDILVDGMSVKQAKNLQKIRTTCGMVFQHAALFPHMDVLANLVMAPVQLLHMPKKEAEDKARFYLEKVGLASKEHSMHNQLSGGEQQRIAIVRALMMNPKAILLDEVTSALDPEMSGEVLKILEQLAKEGVCMIAVTHEMSFARKVSSRILFLEGGKLACDAPTEEFFTTIAKENERVNRFLNIIK